MHMKHKIDCKADVCVCLVTQSCLTLCNPVDYIACQAPLSMGILQVRILEWVAMPFSRGSSQPRNWTQVSHTADRFFTIWATQFSSVQFSCSVVSDSLRPHGLQHARLPVHYQLPEFTQTHVHWVGDAIQPSHPLSSSSPPAFNLSQHQGLFQWISSSHQQVAKVLEFQLQSQSFQWIIRTDFL